MKAILSITIGSIVSIIIICLFIYTHIYINKDEQEMYLPYVIVCHYKDYPYLKEYIESISSKLKNSSLIIYTDENAYFTGKYNYISIRRIPYIKDSINPPSYNKNIKVPCNIVYNNIPNFSDECKVGYLNTEHYTDIVNLEYTKKYLHKSIDYYDYSQSNINIYGHGRYLPYTLMQDEFDKLKLFSTLSMNKSKLFDIGIVGTKSTRRDIIVKKISNEDKSFFLNQNHIQGNDKSNIFYGGYYNNELVGVLTFNNKRNMTKNNEEEFELSRFATKQNYIIIGLASKILKQFINEYNPKTIISFADRRWTIDSNNNLYTNLGFNLVSITKPTYYYYNSKIDKYKRFHKFGFGKNNLKKRFPNLDYSKTEKELTSELGYDKIWDCGLYKYQLTI